MKKNLFQKIYVATLSNLKGPIELIATAEEINTLEEILKTIKIHSLSFNFEIQDLNPIHLIGTLNAFITIKAIDTGHILQKNWHIPVEVEFLADISKEKDFDCYPIQNNAISLKQLVIDELGLALPLHPKENENEFLDYVEENESQNPFSILATMKGKK